MGDSFAVSASNVISHAVSQPALSSVIVEDDDEPPSSGSYHRSFEMNPRIQTSESPVATDHLPAQFFDKEKQGDNFAQVNAVPHLTRALRGQRPTVGSRLRTLFTPTHPLGPPPTYKQSAIAAIRYTPLNICLLFIPVAWALHFTHQSATIVFIFSALGIVPLAALLGFGTEQIALRTSQSVGGLLNATLGNIVEMIIAGIALQKCELEIVQSSLLGGLLSNMLLVLGMAFIVGGFRFPQQEFQPMVAQLNSSLMIVCVTSLIVPVAFHEYLEDRLAPGKEVQLLLQMSRGSAIILISISTFARVDTLPTMNTVEVEHQKMNVPFSLFILVASTALAYVTAEHLVGSLNGLVAAHPSVSKEWLTLIVIPVISNAAEHTTAVVVARKGKFDLAMSVAVGSCIQIALFVIPVLVIVAWGLGKPLTLLFDSLETVVRTRASPSIVRR
ncbi:hypothetical protein H0H81_005701 [Sphagnurus paluster]|uniref:Vacuolar calcium ion transporter n=1 Tax=Sphagnurus paluster TaxID=117069 RepID=A0A9P7KJ41_9AGAR|nr:hypothetical protein H0H81_005701 [Sphagnurus paluster]